MWIENYNYIKYLINKKINKIKRFQAKTRMCNLTSKNNWNRIGMVPIL